MELVNWPLSVRPLLQDSSRSQLQANSPASRVTETRAVILKRKHVNGHYILSHRCFGGYLNIKFGLRVIGLLGAHDLLLMRSFSFGCNTKTLKIENKSTKLALYICLSDARFCRTAMQLLLPKEHAPYLKFPTSKKKVRTET
jgi:hypothetical protein